jgi:hypothetical protein
MVAYIYVFSCNTSRNSWWICMDFIPNCPMYEDFGFRAIIDQTSEAIRASYAPRRTINCIISKLYIMAAL